MSKQTKKHPSWLESDKSLTVKELRNWLSDVPGDAELWVFNHDYGEPFCFQRIYWDGTRVIVDAPQDWE